MSRTRIEVCRKEDLEKGEQMIVQEGRVSIGVFNVDGEYYALQNNCPHQNGPLCEGELSRQIEGEARLGGFTEERFVDDHMVVCPLHAWSFDIGTGEHTGCSDITVPTYDVVVEDGTVYIEP